jgi:K+-transporting ATPase KdpF subunit
LHAAYSIAATAILPNDLGYNPFDGATLSGTPVAISPNLEDHYEPRDLATGLAAPGSADHGPFIRLRFRLRKGVRTSPMLIMTGIVTLLLLVYLLAALLRPEWF